MNDLEQWQEKKEVSTAELDALAKQLREAKEQYQVAKLVSDKHYAVMKEIEDKIVSIMCYAGKKTYIAEGYGRITIKSSLSVTTPKTPEQKEAFFNWIKTNMGMDAYYTYMSVNSNSLNSLYKQKLEEYGEKGEILNIDGLDAPVEYVSLSFTKA